MLCKMDEDLRNEVNSRDSRVVSQDASCDASGSHLESDEIFSAGEGDTLNPRKRQRRDDDRTLIQELSEKVNHLTHLLSQGIPVQVTSDTVLQGPSAFDDTLNLGHFKTDIDEKKLVRPACKERLEILNNLQRFNTPEWKEVRYAYSLKNLVANPGFTELKVNPELCYLDKNKDPLITTERVIAGLTNAVLEQTELLQENLQGTIDMIRDNGGVVDLETMKEVIDLNFGSNSPIFKNTEQTLQVLCGKRAECIEVRRDRLLSEIQNKNVQVALRKVPPSDDFLFNKDNLTSLVTSLGGTQSWLNRPAYAMTKKFPQKKESFRSKPYQSFRLPSRSTQHFKGKTEQRSPGNSFNPKNNNKKEFTKPKPSEFFRRKSDK